MVRRPYFAFRYKTDEIYCIVSAKTFVETDAYQYSAKSSYCYSTGNLNIWYDNVRFKLNPKLRELMKQLTTYVHKIQFQLSIAYRENNFLNWIFRFFVQLLIYMRWSMIALSVLMCGYWLSNIIKTCKPYVSNSI